MKWDEKWTKLLAIGMGLPSTILVTAWLSMALVENGFISKLFGILLFLFVVFDSLFLLVWYAIKQKNK